MELVYSKKVTFEDWGIIDYNEAWNKQTQLHKQLVESKRSVDGNVNSGYFVLCEHLPVYTLGKSGKSNHLLLSKAELNQKGIDYFEINRGGDITHHGPGQIVGYPILDLDHWYHDVHRYVRNVEEIIIRTLADFEIKATRIEGYTGVWIQDGSGQRKICAIGIHMSRWVSMHGFALNVSNDLSLFNHIVPCGITDENKSICSMQLESGKNIELNAVKGSLKQHFKDIFDSELIQ